MLPTQVNPLLDDLRNPPREKEEMATTKTTGIKDGNHALLVGILIGMFMKEGIDAEPMMLGTDYTNQIVVSGEYRITVEPLDY